jgi:hypothetical protein
MNGTLSSNQSRYLSGLFSTPLFNVEGNESLKEAVLDAYLASDSPDNEPDSLPEDIKLLVEYGFRTGQTLQNSKMEDAILNFEEIVKQTESPFPV